MIPTIYELHDILYNEEFCKRYLLDKGVFYNQILCAGCGLQMIRCIERWTFRCPAKRCRRKVTLNKYTFFEGTRLKVMSIINLVLFFRYNII